MLTNECKVKDEILINSMTVSSRSQSSAVSALEIKQLLTDGANVNARTVCGLQPIHYAVYYGVNVEVLRVLLEAGADPNATTDKIVKKEGRRTETATGSTSEADFIDGLDINPSIYEKFVKSQIGETILYFAPTYFNVKNNLPSVWTPLLFATSYSKDPEIVRLLLSYGARVDDLLYLQKVLCKVHSYGPLHLLALRRFGYTVDDKIAIELLNGGASVKLLSQSPYVEYREQSFTALDYAISNRSSITPLLIEANCKVMGGKQDALSDISLKKMMQAALDVLDNGEGIHLQFLESILKLRGYKCGSCQSTWSESRRWCVYNPSSRFPQCGKPCPRCKEDEIQNVFPDFGLPIDDYGGTPLMYLAGHGAVKSIVSSLNAKEIKVNLNINARNSRGETALFLATAPHVPRGYMSGWEARHNPTARDSRENPEDVLFLLESGADATVKTNDGLTAYDHLLNYYKSVDKLILEWGVNAMVKHEERREEREEIVKKVVQLLDCSRGTF